MQKQNQKGEEENSQNMIQSLENLCKAYMSLDQYDKCVGTLKELLDLRLKHPPSKE